MYPDWVRGMFQNNPCVKCRAELSLADIEAIGVRRPMDNEAHLPLPWGLVIATCRHCGQYMHFVMRCPIEPVVDAVRELFWRIETGPADSAANPLPGLDAGQPPAGNRASGKPAFDAAEWSEQPVRPSIRRDQPLTPPTEEEIRHFLNRLRKTSFRRKSKGYAKWIRRFDSDRNGPPTGGDDENRSV